MSTLSDVLEDLRKLGSEISDLEFAYPLEPATFNPPAAAGVVTALVGRAGHPLPEDYREFLLTCAGFRGMDFHNGYDVFGPELVLRLLDQDFQPQRVLVDQLEQPVLAIAGNGGGNLFLLQLAAPWRVWKWNHELPSGAVADASCRALSEIAHGFTDFLRRIADDWRHFLADDPEWSYVAG